MLERERQQLIGDATAARARGALDAARRGCEAVLACAPDDSQALNLMAEIAADARQGAHGLRWARRAVAANPSSAAPHYTMGRLLELDGQLPEAEASYRSAIRIAPDHAKAHNNLGCVLHMQGRLGEALACYRTALALDPALPEANQNYASIARDPAVLEQAVEGYRRQTMLNPNDAEAFNNLANTYRELGRHREALDSFAKAIALDPDLAEAHFSRSFVLLLCGEYREGWKEYEWRWRIDFGNAPPRRFAQPMWDGRRTAGTVLLHAERGLGDTLQFVRYARLVAQRCDSVVLECQAELKSLLGSVPGIGGVVAQGEPLPRFDAHIALMSLPALFGTTLESIPWDGPYVNTDPARFASWRKLVGSGDVRPRIGLAWAGRPQQWDDRKRSISLAMLAPFADAANVIFYSLQKGDAAAQAVSPPTGMALVDLSSHIRDFSDTAALMSQLDLVVTVDTSVAHLAGAMGVPTWVLVAYAPDWRYHLERPDTPWYPTMRLFRQQRDGDWSGPIDRIKDELLALPGAQ